VLLGAVWPWARRARRRRPTTCPPSAAPWTSSSVAAVVRDGRGQIVRRLQREDFQVLEAGVTRPIVEFAASDEGPVSVALLVDVSGSMAAAANLAAARRVVTTCWPGCSRAPTRWLSSPSTGAAREPALHDRSRAAARRAGGARRGGMTSMWDAIGETARRLQERPGKAAGGGGAHRRPGPTRARSPPTACRPWRLPPTCRSTWWQWSRQSIAAGAGVHAAGKPGHVSPVAAGRTAREPHVVPAAACSWASDDLQASDAARTLLAELRHQYLLAIEGSAGPGWRPLEVRLQRRGLKARARTGYYAALPRHAGS